MREDMRWGNHLAARLSCEGGGTREGQLLLPVPPTYAAKILSMAPWPPERRPGRLEEKGQGRMIGTNPTGMDPKEIDEGR
jgi:hypothetical protein